MLIIVIVISALLGILMITPSIINLDNNTTDNDTLNLTTNNTTQQDNNQTTTQKDTQQTKQDTQKSSSSNKGITYDEKLNAYFDENGKTAYDGQFPKGTSREELESYSQADLN